MIQDKGISAHSIIKFILFTVTMNQFATVFGIYLYNYVKKKL